METYYVCNGNIVKQDDTVNGKLADIIFFYS